MRRLIASIVVSLVAAVATVTNPLPAHAWPARVRYIDNVFSGVHKQADITYGYAVDQTDRNVTLELDLYTPKGDTLTSRPAIIWVHGGGFSGGDKTSIELVDEANQFARKGYVNASINYRLAPDGCVGSPGPDCIVGIVQAREDAQTAVRFLRARATKLGIDPRRIAIGGSSAGAITALNVGYSPDDPGAGDHQRFSSAVQAVQSLSGAAILTAPDPGEAPALLFHGTADPLVPYEWAQLTVDEATQAGLDAVLRTFVGDGHVPYLQHRTQILNQTAKFFYRHLHLSRA